MANRSAKPFAVSALVAELLFSVVKKDVVFCAERMHKYCIFICNELKIIASNGYSHDTGRGYNLINVQYKTSQADEPNNVKQQF